MIKKHNVIIDFDLYDLKKQLYVAKKDIIIDMVETIKENTWDKDLCDKVIQSVLELDND